MEVNKGIMQAILEKGNAVNYKTFEFTKDSFTKMIKSLQQDNKRREPMIIVSPYTKAVMENDKSAIAYYEKKMRIDKFTKLRGLINKLGLHNAKVIAWLDKEGKAPMFNSNSWNFYNYGKWIYKDIHNAELDTIHLTVLLEENKFKIKLYADDSDGYSGYKYNVVLSENISFKSILNQIKYFTNKLEKGAY